MSVSPSYKLVDVGVTPSSDVAPPVYNSPDVPKTPFRPVEGGGDGHKRSRKQLEQSFPQTARTMDDRDHFDCSPILVPSYKGKTRSTGDALARSPKRPKHQHQPRECAVCREPERLDFVDLAWSTSTGCHNAHLSCIVETVLQTARCIDFGVRAAPAYYLNANRCALCRSGLPVASLIDPTPMTWFKRFNLRVDTRETYVQRAEHQEAKRGKPFSEICPGCGKLFGIPFRFWEHVQNCDDGHNIKMPCTLCSKTFPYENDLQAAFIKHYESGGCKPQECPCVSLCLVSVPSCIGS